MPRLLATVVGLNAALVAVTWIRNGGPQPPWIALEALIVAGALGLAPARRWSAAVTWVGGAVLALLVVLAVAERLTVLSLARPLNVYLDWRLLPAVHDLLGGQAGSGAVLAALALGAAGLLALAAAWIASRCLRALRGTAVGGRPRITAIALLAAGGLGAAAQPWLGAAVGAPGWTFAAEQVQIALETRAEARRFAARLERGGGDGPTPLPDLAGVDVIVGFVESYGTSALTDPRYAPTVRPELERAQGLLDAAGLHVASGRVVAPSQGGQSWLGHGSFLSGHWLDSQIRYDLLLASDRTTLVDDLEASGHRSVAVMPAITEPWVAGELLGYDEILDAARIDYAGPALNWVTMPDQYTWTVVERARRARDDAPVFVETALISSHAPWVPILPVLDWDEIDDGAVFGQWADAGERPEVLWRDVERVREHFARALAYAVRVAGEYAARHVDDDTLLIVLGDHQPAPLITGEDAARTVPVHVISGDPSLVEPFRERGFVTGMEPPASGEAPRMTVMRGWLHAAFGETTQKVATPDASGAP